MERRKFIRESALTSAGIFGALGVSGTFLASCGSSKKGLSGGAQSLVGFDQAALTYGLNALEPYIDATTMDIHFNRHAAAYTKNMKDAMAAENVSGMSLENLCASISKYSVKLRNNAGGHYNHESFWKWMTPGGKAISPAMSTLIEQSFGSINDMKNQFNAAATQRFGSGWAWLVLDNQKKLKIGSTPNQDNPLMDVSDFKGYPLLGLDVWEHAYYLKYQNKRADYIAAWWNIVNWQEVEKRYQHAVKFS